MIQIEIFYLTKELDKDFAPCYEHTYFRPRSREIPDFKGGGKEEKAAYMGKETIAEWR
jgi:hypothetical protein